MKNNQFNDIEFNQFYYSLKNNFRSAIHHSLSQECLHTYSEILSIKIDQYFDTIFGIRDNSSLYDYYNSLYFEIKDVVARNNKIIEKTASDFSHSFSYYIDRISESSYIYIIKSSFIEKKLGFQKGDRKFNTFLITHLLQNLRFENQDFYLTDNSYGTIINAFIKESIKNIRKELFDKKLIGAEEILNDINTLEIKKSEGKFEFLEEAIKLLRLLKVDIESNTIQSSNINILNQQIEFNHFSDNRELKITTNDNRHIDKHYISNHHNAYNSTHIENNTYLNTIPPAPEKPDKTKKITITFSPFKFRNLLIKFFENADVKIDSDKINKIDRFILNVVDYNKTKHKTFTGSSSEESINFFDKKYATILKFCSLLLFIMKQNKMNDLGDEPLEKILITELREINSINLGISTNLRNKIRDDLRNLSKEQLAHFAGFETQNDINKIINR